MLASCKLRHAKRSDWACRRKPPRAVRSDPLFIGEPMVTMGRLDACRGERVAGLVVRLRPMSESVDVLVSRGGDLY